MGAISRAQALECGFTRHSIEARLRSGKWLKLCPSTYAVASAPEPWLQRLMGACLWAGPGAAVSHRAAAAVLKLDGFSPGIVEISAPRSVRPPRLVRVHRMSDLHRLDISLTGPLPVTSVARTLIDLGAVVGEEEVERALEDALRQDLVSLSRLRWTLERVARNGRAGATILRRLLAERGNGYLASESSLELELIRLVRSAGLPQPVRQYRVRDGGKVLARVDFAYPEMKLAIEVDGYEYHSRRAEWQRDRRAQNDLVLRGWRVIRLTKADLRERPRQVLALIRAARNMPPSS